MVNVVSYLGVELEPNSELCPKVSEMCLIEGVSYLNIWGDVTDPEVQSTIRWFVMRLVFENQGRIDAIQFRASPPCNRYSQALAGGIWKIERDYPKFEQECFHFDRVVMACLQIFKSVQTACTNLPLEFCLGASIEISGEAENLVNTKWNLYTIQCFVVLSRTISCLFLRVYETTAASAKNRTH